MPPSTVALLGQQVRADVSSTRAPRGARRHRARAAASARRGRPVDASDRRALRRQRDDGPALAAAARAQDAACALRPARRPAAGRSSSANARATAGARSCASAPRAATAARAATPRRSATGAGASRRFSSRRPAGGASTCGFDAYVGALQFHHLDPATKAFEVSRQGITRSLQRLRLEARKCVLLCANCHAMVEAGLLTLPVPADDRGSTTAVAFGGSSTAEHSDC